MPEPAMHVVVTRPKEASEVLAAKLRELGCDVSIAPLLEIEFETIDHAALAGAGALVATSRYGLEALANANGIETVKHLPVYAVGRATAETATGLGFKTVVHGSDNAAALAPLIARGEAGTGKPVIHLAGDHLASDLAPLLEPDHIELRKLTAYRSVAASALPPEIVARLTANRPDTVKLAVILMSPRTAGIWTRLAATAAAPGSLRTVTHICLSPAVAAEIPADTVRLVAQRPDSGEILELVKRLAAQARPE